MPPKKKPKKKEMPESTDTLVITPQGASANTQYELDAAKILKDMKGGSLKQKAKAKTNPWIKHIKATQKKMGKGASYKDAMKEAKKTYKK